MALSAIVETYVNKSALIKKKELEIEQLLQDMASDISPHQTSIVDIQTDYNNQIATKRSEIDQLNEDIRNLAIS